ncbi:MAG TPA: branched-chain amino acid ABC transporter permease [Burkholderiaceae bacterium]|nr:branched-chain amino acid ABC transporter permease [Burkholderiaceae bacterium]
MSKKSLASLSFTDKLPRPRVPNARWHWLEILFWLSPLIVFFFFKGYLVLASQIMIVALFALSLDLILGYAGIVSLGHAAFFGLGAYTSGLLSVHGWGEPITGLLAGAVVAGIVGYLTSFLIVRGQDLTRLMVTLGICLMLYEVANKAAFITGGVDGLWGIATQPLFGVFDFDLYGNTAFFYCWGVLFALFVLLRRMTRSTYGLSLIGIREKKPRMDAIGTNVNQRLIVTYTVGCAIAGVAGALLAQTTQFVSLDALGFERSADLLIILVLGGTGRLYGALVGAVVFMIAQDQIANINPVYWQFWIGLFLVIIVLLGSGGILGGIDAYRQRRRDRRQIRASREGA